jgi:hypothetical protein
VSRLYEKLWNGKAFMKNYGMLNGWMDEKGCRRKHPCYISGYARIFPEGLRNTT